MQELGPNQTKWLEDLETTDAPQTTDFLCDSNGYCCLGRACEVFLGAGVWSAHRGCFIWGKENSGGDGWEVLDHEIVQLLALYGSGGQSNKKDGSSLADLNDDGKTFKEIAAIIREDPSVYFRHPT